MAQNPKFPAYQFNFGGGEVAPDLYGRADMDLYYAGMRKCRNSIVRQYGGVSSRSGTKFVGYTNYTALSAARLIPFEYNDQQTYVLELGDLYMRIIQNGAYVTEAAKAITGATQANPCVITCVGHGYSTGEEVNIYGVAGMRALNGRQFKITVLTANTFSISTPAGVAVNSTGYEAYTSGGFSAKTYSRSTPWPASVLYDLGYTQSNDVITITHPNYAPQDITRTSATAWTVSATPYNEGPFKDENATTTTVYASATTGAVTITASSGIFTAAHVGSLFRIGQNSSYAVPIWETQKGVRYNTIWRAGPHYYRSNTAAPTTRQITDFTGGPPVEMQISGTDPSWPTGTALYVSDYPPQTEPVGKFFKTEKKSATSYLLYREDNAAISGSNWAGAGPSAAQGSVENAYVTGTYKPDHTEGSERDGSELCNPTWEYLHSGFGIVQITGYTSATQVTATVIKRLSDGCVGAGYATDEWAFGAWSEVEGYPSTACYHKSRMIFAATKNQPNGIYFSEVGLRTSHKVSNPILADNGITMKLDTTQLNAVRHLLPFSDLIALTSSSEHLITGENSVLDAAGTLLNKTQGYTGASKVKPIIIKNTALFVQDMGNTLNMLAYTFESDSYTGTEASLRSPHLFEGRTVVDMAYQRHPFSIVWCVMSDGALLGLTFLQDQKFTAWHRHDTDGLFESVACVREGQETATYFIVRRTINGQTVRMVERLASRYFTRVEDAFCVDSGLTYNGTNTSATTMTLTGGTLWNEDETLTLTASTASFASTDVNNSEIRFYNGTDVVRLRVVAFTSSTVVSVVPTQTVPVSLRAAAQTNWQHARKVLYGLAHLEGKAVSVLADGNVIAGVSVSGLAVTLPQYAGICHIGLPYTCEVETMDIAGAQARVFNKAIQVNRVRVMAQASRAFQIAVNPRYDDDYVEVKQRNADTPMDAPSPIATRLWEAIPSNTQGTNQRVSIRQQLPVPFTLLSIMAEVTQGDD